MLIGKYTGLLFGMLMGVFFFFVSFAYVQSDCFTCGFFGGDCSRLAEVCSVYEDSPALIVAFLSILLFLLTALLSDLLYYFNVPFLIAYAVVALVAFTLLGALVGHLIQKVLKRLF